jgi:hypothetical protein
LDPRHRRGIVEATFFRFAEDTRKLLDDGDKMRVLPTVTYGSASNIDDLLDLRPAQCAGRLRAIEEETKKRSA